MAHKPAKGRGRKPAAERRPVRRKPARQSLPPLALTVSEWRSVYRVESR
jgi:hypothetical protein